MTWTNEKHERLSAQLERLEQRVDTKNLKRYKLHLLEGVSRRTTELTTTCPTCNELMKRAEVNMQEFDDLGITFEWQQLKEMKPLMQQFLNHLEKEHQIVEPDHYLGQYMAMGVAIGVALGAALQNPAIGISLGIAIGLAIGASMDSKAKEEDRVI